jgi:hypothetical protein|tara:strand:+ start:108 stop:269 length:162 start_codon:yes stop_codon:yes gene_type:complete
VVIVAVDVFVVLFISEKSFAHLVFAFFAGRTRARNTLVAELIFAERANEELFV